MTAIFTKDIIKSVVYQLTIIVVCFFAFQVSVFSPYWLVNKTGLPLVFRREGESTEAAGQFEEHESARSLTPLLFSYIDEESMYRCQMRIGKNLYPDQPTSPIWYAQIIRPHC